MAERKYDLLLVGTGNKVISKQPWYKERLQTRYIKSHGREDGSEFFIGKDWMFIKDGLDDFRDGLPPPTNAGIFIQQNNKGLGPNVSGSKEKMHFVKQPIVRNRFTKEETCFSKSTPMQQQKRNNIDEIEFGLTQHPLALYQHLEDSMAPDIFEEIVDLLDPEMNLLEDGFSSDDVAFSTSQTDRQDNQETIMQSKSAMTEAVIEDEKNNVKGNPYRWLAAHDKDKNGTSSDIDPVSAAQDKHIQQITKEFCEWTANLGGDSNNIEESTVSSLFASGYETKPALSVPIHVVELTSVPPELRANVVSAAPKNVPDATKSLPKSLQHKKRTEWSYSGEYEPSWVKFRYGSWYLPTNQWRKLNYDEPLVDPKELLDTKQIEAKKRSEELDIELAPIHGTHAFMDFLNRKSGCRKPQFITQIEELQRRTAQEEKLKSELEHRAGRRSNQPPVAVVYPDKITIS